MRLFTKASEERVFRYVYEHVRASKQLIARDLDLSLPTVTQALAHLAEEGLVARRGAFPSTGGRPAAAYELLRDARYAMGIEIVAEQVRVAFVDLCGGIIAQDALQVGFEHTERYMSNLASYLDAMTARLDLSRERLLGATIAIQGIVSADARVTFGGLLGDDGTEVSLEDFAQYLRFPLFFAHDAEAAAYAEIWRHKDLENFAYLSLNDHLGSALVRDGRLVQSEDFGAGVAEHMVANPLGLRCYCGSRGCFETLLGALALERQAGTTAQRFFEEVQRGEAGAKRVWDTYLDYLALLIHNLRMVACGDVVIGGRLSRYMTQRDFRALRTKVNRGGVLSKRDFHLLRGHYQGEATALGAAIMVVERYLNGSLIL